MYLGEDNSGAFSLWTQWPYSQFSSSVALFVCINNLMRVPSRIFTLCAESPEQIFKEIQTFHKKVNLKNFLQHFADVILKCIIYIVFIRNQLQHGTCRFAQLKQSTREKLTIYPLIINQTHTSPRPHPTPTPHAIPLVKNGFFCPNITQASISGHIVKYQDDFVDPKVFDDTWSIPRTNQLTDLIHPGFISGAQCALKRIKEISNKAYILVLDGDKCAISAQYTNCIVECFRGNEADHRIAAR